MKMAIFMKLPKLDTYRQQFQPLLLVRLTTIRFHLQFSDWLLLICEEL